jgi:hypothetical protein
MIRTIRIEESKAVSFITALNKAGYKAEFINSEQSNIPSNHVFFRECWGNIRTEASFIEARKVLKSL